MLGLGAKLDSQPPPRDDVVGMRLLSNRLEKSTNHRGIFTTQTVTMRHGHNNEVRIFKFKKRFKYVVVLAALHRSRARRRVRNRNDIAVMARRAALLTIAQSDRSERDTSLGARRCFPYSPTRSLRYSK